MSIQEFSTSSQNKNKISFNHGHKANEEKKIKKEKKNVVDMFFNKLNILYTQSFLPLR